MISANTFTKVTVIVHYNGLFEQLTKKKDYKIKSNIKR